MNDESHMTNNGCDMSKPLTNPHEDSNARCNHCKWFLNRCMPTRGCVPYEYAAEDRAVWTR